MSVPRLGTTPARRFEATRRHDAPTRRDYLRGGGALVGGGLLAGCTGRVGDADTTATSTGAAGETSTYTVTMSPMGEVTFEGVPTDVLVYLMHVADMAVAVGHGDAVNSLKFTEVSGKTMNFFYGALEGVSFDWKGLTQLWDGGLSPELFYELDSDVHFMDPCLATTYKGWSRDDVAAIRKNVGPWFGNVYSRAHGTPPEGCRDGYRYYTLWKLFGKVAQVFRESERAAALAAIHDELESTIRTNLPPRDERPSVGLLIFQGGVFYPFKINVPGFGKAHIRPLGATDAFAGIDATLEGSAATLDYGGLLDVDPDVILHNFGITPYYSMADVRETIRTHPLGSRLSAIENDRFYASGTPHQGPLMNLFQLEMTAKQLYPEQFGEWPGYTDGEPYPEIPRDEWLFDRQRVARVAGKR